MTRVEHPLRRWTAALTLVAVASLGLALHVHPVGSAASATAIEAAADPTSSAHEPGRCLACRAHGRDRLAPALAGSAPLALLAPTLPLEAIEVPAVPSAGSPPPTPPRGPPLPTT